MGKLSEILNTFDTLTLQEAERFSLKNRKDTKFIFHSEFLPQILKETESLYNVLTVNNNLQSLYQTLYFDTEDMQSYLAHHNGRKNRYKVRYRKYLETDDVFLEVKFKTNKGKTVKKRIKQEEMPEYLPEEASAFISRYTPYSKDGLQSLFYSTFNRITLIHKYRTERVTLDLNLKFYNEDFNQFLNNLIIAEVKTENLPNASDFIKILRKNRIRSSKISKYCTGAVLYMPDIKQNRFKKRFIKLQKIINDV